MTQLTAQMVLGAYSIGVFPMAESAHSSTIHWFDPELRGIIPLDEFHLPRRLERTVRAGSFEVRVDSAFGEVIRACAAPAADRPKTWINDSILGVYEKLAGEGHAHSVESWRGGKLLGGLYGVALGGAFFGESMFSRARDASKVALVHLVARMKANGFTLLDTQFVTAHLARFGAREIPRDVYRRMLSLALDQDTDFRRGSEAEVLQCLLTEPG